jgi:hypothetical protein
VVPKGERTAPIEIGFRAEHLALDGPVRNVEAPYLEHVDASFAVTSDLTASQEVVSAKLAPARLVVPSLAWLTEALGGAPKAPKLKGTATLDLSAHRDDKGGFIADAGAAASDFAASTPDFSLAAGIKLDAHLVSPKPQSDSSPRSARFEKLSLAFERATLGLGSRASNPWNATLASTDLEVSEGATRVRGSARLDVSKASAFLPLVSTSALVRKAESTLLALGGLEAEAKFHIGEESRFDLLRAHAGAAWARGYLTQRDDKSHGAFLVTTPLTNIGVRVNDEGTHVALFVDEHFLDEKPALRKAAH